MLSSCTLLDVSRLLTFSTASGDAETRTAFLQKLPTPPDAIVLEIVLIERPASDPLLGESLWREVDEIGSVDLTTRKVLQKNGLRVGRVGANPPRALQSLLNHDLEIGQDEAAGCRLSCQRLTRPSGAEAKITASEVRLLRNLTVIAADDSEELETLDNARCVFRMRPRKLQDGWARIEFLPEIHHGEFANRATATTSGWQMKTTQKIEKFYDQQFAVDLNLGEMVILTSSGGPEYGLGANFFRGLGEDEDLQRLLVIRLADLDRAELLFAE